MATVVEDNQKAPFSIATTLRCRGIALLLYLDCFTLPLIRNIYCWVLSKEVSSTILKVFGITQPEIEHRSPGPLANTLATRPVSRIINGSFNLGQTTRPYNNKKKKRTSKMVDFAVPADHRVKLKENEKKDKYQDLARELKNRGT